MSSITRNQVFSAVHTIGNLLPVDLLLRVAEGKDISGSTPSDYRVVGSRSVRDEAERHWEFLRSVWADLRMKLPAAPQDDAPADPTGLAVPQWLMPLFTELGFGELTPLADGILAESGDKTFPVAYLWNHVPIHVTPWNSELDKRPSGAGSVPPQSLLQELLNRTDAHLWGVVTNGRQVRLLRDSNALSTASYVEFDLEAIFDGELFSEFVLLYRMLHVSRFAVADGAGPATCWLERWRLDAISSGTRALDQLREGVENAITTLGTGFLRHPANTALRENVDPQELHRALLRLVYRLLFVFVVEDREVLHPRRTAATEEGKHAEELARERYAAYFSTAKLRAHARRRRGSTHDDLYRALRLVLDALGEENGRPELALPGLGGIFDRTEADAPLEGLSLSNEYLLGAVRHLSQVRDPASKRLRTVDYRHLDAEELGSIYESLLERVPKHSTVDREFTLVALAGNERKTTGSYYTPASLIECLLDSSLDPVLDDAVKRGEQRATQAGNTDPSDSIVEELLSLTVCDPACGSGHFLLAAARRIAKRVASVRERNPEPTVDAVRQALHEVIARCIYGVDLNPIAVELVKVSLWLEAMEPGKPLSFLDAHVKVGNALIGATPSLIREGIPDKAFKPTEGDDEKIARKLQDENLQQRTGQFGLFEAEENVPVANREFGANLREIIEGPSGTLTAVRRKEKQYEAWQNADEYQHARHVADAWCAAFMWYKTTDAPPAITHDVFQNIRAGSSVDPRVHEEIAVLSERYQFFHWHLAFPDVFTVDANDTGSDREAGWSGGFDCLLGNPPWDKVDFEDKKYFSAVESSIAEISGVTRRDHIAEWAAEHPEEGRRYYLARRKQKSTFHFAGSSGLFPLCAHGLSIKGVNSLLTDQLFTELFSTVVAATGRAGCIIQSSIATGAGAQYLFSDFTRRGSIRMLYDFENRNKLFDIHRSYKFCLFSFGGHGLHEPESKFAFFLLDVVELDDPTRTFTLAPEEIALINPNTGNLPIFRDRRDAELTAAIYRRIPVLWDETTKSGNRWGIVFKNLFNMTDDSDLFRTREQLEREGWELDGNVFVRGEERMLPLYEAKMVDFFNHRAADVVKSKTAVNRQNQPRYLTTGELQDPNRLAMPLNWIAESGLIQTRRKNKDVKVPGVQIRLEEVGWERDWLCGWSDVTSPTNERTAIPTFIPRTAVGHTFPLMFPHVSPDLVAALITTQSSLVFDFVSRQKVNSNHMALMTWKQLPVPTPQTMKPHTPFVIPRVLELTYTAHDMSGLAKDLDDSGAPFRWDEERRSFIRAELDAYFFHLYGIERTDVDYILETFQSDTGGLKNSDIKKYGTYRTKDLILAEYDRMATAGVSLDTPLVDGDNYASTLNPPPGQGPRHPAREARP
ncbi:Methyltransferase domain-containing protein [Actinopolyspora alba]|uniref:site-specific DNA-methyltransferase (adenine-specific) n=1 Tax=Actinopolyspora alba TaxID=673379 RepID=A0A1I1YYN2_9ACTN|nr:DNA methyltransferase [Actinopolyspora alba]SFE23130.1 Methyltransferase domain-containing protein [Actinopolyspora alba]